MANLRLCSVQGCDKPHRAKGYCGAHYWRFIQYGDPLGGGTIRGEPASFLENVAYTYKGTECLIWPYGKSSSGYGTYKHKLVSRLVCEHFNGPPPSPSHDALHSCGNGHLGCCASSHLRWGTPTENAKDADGHGTLAKGERNGQAKLTEEAVRTILSLKGKLSQSAISKQFGVHYVTIHDIHTRKTWAWVQC